MHPAPAMVQALAFAENPDSPTRLLAPLDVAVRDPSACASNAYDVHFCL